MRPIDSDFVFELPAVDEPAVSPDGALVAYVASRTDRDTMRGESHIEARPFTGGEARRLTVGPHDGSPRFSPDGATLAFLRRTRDAEDRPQAAQLWLLPLEGGEPEQLSDLEAAVLDFTWSPDGDSIVVVTDVDPDRLADDDPAKDIPRPRVVSGLYYRGDTLGWRGRTKRQLVRIGMPSGHSKRLTRGDFNHRSLEISPDGEWLAFVSDRSRGRALREPWGGELCVMPAEGGRVQRLVRDLAVSGPLRWSPDGASIAFVASEEANPWQSYVHLVEVASGEHLRLTTDAIQPQTGFFPVVRPPLLHWYRRRLAFLAEARGTSGVYSVTARGDVRAERTTGELLGGLSADASGRRLATISTTPDRPGEVLTLDRSTGRARRVTDVAAPYLADHSTGTTERFSIRREGQEIDCRLTRPAGFREGGRYPLVLDIHGGPNGFFGSGFNPLHQVLAGAGYLVLAVNPRGSSTYGADFTAQVFEDWGGEDYLDLTAALDTVAARPYVDDERLGVHGYSYGGYMSAWMVGQSERFGAAVLGAPVINLVSMYGQTDIAVTFGEPQWGGQPHENFEEYVRRSPLTHASKVTTPVLLLHGEADIRVPISQSEEYYVALKRQRKEVEFVRYPQCSHLFLRVGHPALRKNYYDRVVEWFDRWLG